MANDPISLVISSLTLAISATTAWFTLVRSGTVKMTRRTTIFFGPDGKGGSSGPKVYLRTLLFAPRSAGGSSRVCISRYQGTKQNRHLTSGFMATRGLFGEVDDLWESPGWPLTIIFCSHATRAISNSRKGLTNWRSSSSFSEATGKRGCLLKHFRFPKKTRENLLTPIAATILTGDLIHPAIWLT